MKLKHFYDHFNRQQVVHVWSLIAMIAMKAHYCLSHYFLTCDLAIWYRPLINQPPPPPSAHLTLRNGIVTN